MPVVLNRAAWCYYPADFKPEDTDAPTWREKPKAQTAVRTHQEIREEKRQEHEARERDPAATVNKQRRKSGQTKSRKKK
jgi:hypothetical protein